MRSKFAVSANLFFECNTVINCNDKVSVDLDEQSRLQSLNSSTHT